ncbi:hypothetical protein Bhyg_16935 [Pseudolycoriella hygida]|uniref:Uncharacterized protein n=1 Tax=Pseudolycoriella hygida TaxID=35572 RepID=A0A9Q0RT81_9DIPT|nr:hypothetical protein Bhyg_16935 [Pseudolycoriella hygida]
MLYTVSFLQHMDKLLTKPIITSVAIIKYEHVPHESSMRFNSTSIYFIHTSTADAGKCFSVNMFIVI